MSSETAQILHSLGLSRELSEVLASLQDSRIQGARLTVADIMDLTGLQQPQVSRGGLEGEAKGWIKIESRKREGKFGAPYKLYSLAIPFCRIIEFLEAQKAGEALVISRKVEHLKELVA